MGEGLSAVRACGLSCALQVGSVAAVIQLRGEGKGILGDDGVSYATDGILSKFSPEEAQPQSLVQSPSSDLTRVQVEKIVFNSGPLVV